MVGQGAALDANQINNALYALDTLTDMWSNEPFLIYTKTPYIFPINAGQRVYTLGPANASVGAIKALNLTAMTGGSTGTGNTAGSGYNSGLSGVFNNVPLKPAIVHTSGGTTLRAEVSNPQPFDSGEMIGVNIADGGAGYRNGTNYTTIPGTLDQVNGPGAGAIAKFDVVGGIVIPHNDYDMASYGNVMYSEPINININDTSPGSTNDPFQNAYVTPTPGYQSSYGTGGIVNVTVQNGVISDIEIVVAGQNYATGDLLTVDPSYLGGGTPTTLFSVGIQDAEAQTDWIVERPQRIEKAYVIWNQSTYPQAVDIPVTLLTMEEYAQISVKNTPSTFAFSMYDDNSYPVRDITVFPIPNQNGQMRLWLREPLVDATIEALDKPINYPPGYEKLFRYALAIELAPEYGKVPAPEIVQSHINNVTAMKQQNSASYPQYKAGDGGLSNRDQGYWNWITGGFTPPFGW